MKTSVLEIEKPDKPKLSTRIALLKMEVQGWVNGQYIQRIRQAIAVKLKDQQMEKSLTTELQQSMDMIDALKKEHLKLGAGELVIDVPAEVKQQLIERELIDRNSQVYILQLRASAAHQVKNKELEESTTALLERNLGTVDYLKKELRQIREASKAPSKKG